LEDSKILWPIQAITHLFIHGSLLHLLSNVMCIGILSVYERRVGSRRFLAVLSVSCIASIPSIFFYSLPTIICGISGGVFGLAAAYFTDHDDLTNKEWVYGVISFLCLALFFSFRELLETNSQREISLNIDYYGHALGAMGAIIYCRARKNLTMRSTPTR
jgi:rhomboid protease GluP